MTHKVTLKGGPHNGEEFMVDKGVNRIRLYEKDEKPGKKNRTHIWPYDLYRPLKNSPRIFRWIGKRVLRYTETDYSNNDD